MKKIIQITTSFALVFLGVECALAQSANWNGFYLGFGAGYAQDHQSFELSRSLGAIALGSNDVDKKSAIIGSIQGGHNWQNNDVVYGVEVDFNGPSIKHREVIYKDWGYANDTITSQSRVNWFSTIRGRAGFLPQSDWLVYATGGLAVGRVNTQSQFTVNYPNFSAGNGTVAGQYSDTKYGWTLGAGTEYQVSKESSWKVEYLYTDLKAENKNYAIAGAYWNGAPIRYYVRNDTKFSLVKLGFNYKF